MVIGVLHPHSKYIIINREITNAYLTLLAPIRLGTSCLNQGQLILEEGHKAHRSSVGVPHMHKPSLGLIVIS